MLKNADFGNYTDARCKQLQSVREFSDARKISCRSVAYAVAQRSIIPKNHREGLYYCVVEYCETYLNIHYCVVEHCEKCYTPIVAQWSVTRRA